MSDSEYLQSILQDQILKNDDKELEALRAKRNEIEAIIRRAFSGANLSFRYGGSKAKGTMIKESYDLDLVCYFANDETCAGDTLEEIYNNIKDVLDKQYTVQPKRSSLQLMNPDDETYTHVDVVPGRFVDDSKEDVFLHQNEGTKVRLKTNLGIHIEHIGKSGLTDTIKLIKLWRERKLLKLKTFILELLVVKTLGDHKHEDFDSQLRTFFETLRDNIENITIEDPANSNNDLTPIYDDKKFDLQRYANATIDEFEIGGWKTVFGDPEQEISISDRVATISTIPSTRPSGTKPWS